MNVGPVFFIQKELKYDAYAVSLMIQKYKSITLFAIQEKSCMHCGDIDYKKTQNNELKKYLFCILDEDIDCAKVLLDMVFPVNQNIINIKVTGGP